MAVYICDSLVRVVVYEYLFHVLCFRSEEHHGPRSPHPLVQGGVRFQLPQTGVPSQHQRVGAV